MIFNRVALAGGVQPEGRSEASHNTTKFIAYSAYPTSASDQKHLKSHKTQPTAANAHLVPLGGASPIKPQRVAPLRHVIQPSPDKAQQVFRPGFLADGFHKTEGTG